MLTYTPRAGSKGLGIVISEKDCVHHLDLTVMCSIVWVNIETAIRGRFHN